MKYFYLSTFLLFWSYCLPLFAQPIIQQDNFNDESQRLNWMFENTHLIQSVDWEFTDNAGQNIDGTPMAYFYDDETFAHQTVGVGRMISPKANLEGVLYAELAFDYNYQHYAISDISTTFRVEVFDGTDWQIAWERTEDDCGAWENCNDFNRAQVDVTTYANADFQVRFVFDDGSLVGYFAAVDNYELRAAFDCLDVLPRVTYRLIDECPTATDRTYTCEFTVSNLIEGESVGVTVSNKRNSFSEALIMQNGTYTVAGLPECTYTKVERDCSFQAQKYGCDCDIIIFDDPGLILCCTPLNDDCVEATDIGNAPSYEERLSDAATDSGMNMNCEVESPISDTWFKRSAPSSGYLQYQMFASRDIFLPPGIVYSEVYTGDCNNLQLVTTCVTNEATLDNLPTTGELYFRVWSPDLEAPVDIQFDFNEDPCNLPLFTAMVNVPDCESSLEYEVQIDIATGFPAVDILVNDELAHAGVSGGNYAYTTAPAADGTMTVQLRQTNRPECTNSQVYADPCCLIPVNDDCANATHLASVFESMVTISDEIGCPTSAGEGDLPTCTGITPPSGGVWYFIDGEFDSFRGVRVSTAADYTLYAFAGNGCNMGCPNLLSGQGTRQVVFFADNQTGNRGGTSSLDYYIYVVKNTESTNLDLLYETKSGVFEPALPLTWLRFTATTYKQQNELRWKAGTAQNVAHYRVEYSATGDDNWLVLGEVAARAATMTQEYQFVDEHPSVQRFYRIISVDKDGLTMTSLVRRVEQTTVVDVQLFPNPVNDQLSIRWNKLETTTLEVQIFNLAGQLVLQQQWENATSAPQIIDVRALTAGVYLVRLNDGETQQMYRLVRE